MKKFLALLWGRKTNPDSGWTSAPRIVRASAFTVVLQHPQRIWEMVCSRACTRTKTERLDRLTSMHSPPHTQPHLPMPTRWPRTSRRRAATSRGGVRADAGACGMSQAAGWPKRVLSGTTVPAPYPHFSSHPASCKMLGSNTRRVIRCHGNSLLRGSRKHCQARPEICVLVPEFWARCSNFWYRNRGRFALPVSGPDFHAYI